MTTEITPETRRVARGAVTGGERAPAPDLARGMMLLIIALAHSACVFYLMAPGAVPEPVGMERVYNLFLFTFVHARGLPLFAIMFGYALVQIARRQADAGATPQQIRSVLLRRNGWLFVFGAAHGILLFDGDILGGYGLIGIAFALLVVRRGDRFMSIAGGGYLVFGLLYLAVLAALTVIGLTGGQGRNAPLPFDAFASFAAEGYPASIAVRLSEWPITTLIFLALFLYTFVGAWAARRRVLEEPHRYRGLLWGGAVGGLTVSIAGGAVMGCYAAGYLTVDADTIGWVRSLYEVSGFFGGIGYGCLFGLLAIRLTRRRRPRGVFLTAVTALGQRSLSGYLAQSVCWLILATPYTLDLADTFSANGLVVLAVGCGVWVLTVAGAYALHRAHHRGPAEQLLRRLTYGRR